RHTRFSRDWSSDVCSSDLLRANLLDELQKQYVVTGRAKGLPPFRLLVKYPLRMSLNPFIADIGSLLPHIISGAVIVSVVLNLPKLGRASCRETAVVESARG